MATDLTNTGDHHGTIADALSTSHAHHGEHTDAPDAFPTDTLSTPKPPTKILGRHAELIGMVQTSQPTINRLEHLKNNIHYGDAVSRQRLKTWLERNTANSNDPHSWDSMIG